MTMAQSSSRKLARVWKKSANPYGRRGAGAERLQAADLDEAQRQILLGYVAKVRAWQHGGQPVIVMMASPEQTKLAAKRRQQQRRIRASKNISLLQDVPVKDEFRLIDRLIERGLLRLDQSTDPRAVCMAAGRVLELFVTRDWKLD